MRATMATNNPESEQNQQYNAPDYDINTDYVADNNNATNSSTKNKKGGKGSAVNKRALIVFVLILIFPFIFHFCTGSQKETAEQDLKTDVPITPPSSVATDTNIQSTDDQAMSQSQQNGISIQVAPTDDNSIASMKKTIDDYEDLVNNLQDSINTLDQKVDELDEKIVELESLNVKKENPERQINDFYLVSVVKGRAWLLDKNGATRSVNVGSSLGWYGKITQIDDEKGIVKTSKNFIITYSPKDL